MAKYEISLVQTCYYHATVDALSEAEAIEKAKDAVYMSEATESGCDIEIEDIYLDEEIEDEI